MSFYSRAYYVASGEVETYAIPFPYLARGDVRLYVGDEEVAFTFPADALALPEAVAVAGSRVSILRRSGPDASKVTYRGGPIASLDLNLQATQQLYLNQEALDDGMLALRVPPGEAGEGLELPSQADRAGMLLGFDEQGRPTVGLGGTNLAGSFKSFPRDISGADEYVLVDAQTAFLMAEAVTNAKLVEVFRNGVPQIPGVDYTVNGTTTGTLTSPAVEGETLWGLHSGGASAVSQPAVSTLVAYTDPALGAMAETLFSRSAAQAPTVPSFVGIYCNGLQDDAPGIAALMGTTIRGWDFGRRTYYIMSNLTIPAGKRMMTWNATFVVSPGVTLRFLSEPDFPEQRVFYGTGLVAGIRRPRPEWWGAKGDYNEATNTFTTDDASFFQLAINCLEDAQSSEVGMSYLRTGNRAYAWGSAVELKPRLNNPTGLIGAGWSPAGSGSRFYSVAGAGQLKVRGTYAADDNNRIAEWTLQNFAILPSPAAAATGLLIAGDAGPTAKMLDSLHPNLVRNISVSNFLTSVAVQSARLVTFVECSFRSGSVVGTSTQLTVGAGAFVTAEITFVNCIWAQPGGTCVAIVNADNSVGSAALAEVRNINFTRDCELYAGPNGTCFYIFCDGGSVASSRTIGDIVMDPTTKMEGDSTFAANYALYVEAKDLGDISTIKASPWVEGFDGGPTYKAPLVFIETATAANYGRVRDIQLRQATFRYLLERCMYVDRAQVTLLGASLESCGGSAMTATEHFLFSNARSGRLRDVITTTRDAVSWPGAATGFTVTGAGTKSFKSSANELGRVTAKAFAGSVPGGEALDSTDQPSTLEQL